MPSVAATMIVPRALGKMCRSMIRALPTPMARAASTYSSSLRLKNEARTKRANPIQLTMPMTNARRRQRLPDDGDENHRHDDGREHEHDVGEAHEQVVDNSAEIAGDAADGYADDQRNDHGQHAYGERHPSAEHGTRQLVAAEIIGTEGMRQGGRLQAQTPY